MASNLKKEIISKAIARYEKRLQKLKDDIDKCPNIELAKSYIELNKKLNKDGSTKEKLALIKKFEEKKSYLEKKIEGRDYIKLIEQESALESDLYELRNWLCDISRKY